MAKRKKLRFGSTKNLVYSRELTYKYHDINKKYFGGCLPNLEVYFQPMGAFTEHGERMVREGHTGFSERWEPLFIAISNKLQKFSDLAELVLVHEMIHVRYPKGAINHGKVFQKERRRLIRAGAVDDIL